MASLLFFLAVYGAANAIAVLKFGQYFIGTWDRRKFLGKIPIVGDLLYCPPCLSFWIGGVFSLWMFSPSSPFIGRAESAAFVDGLAASAVSYLIHLAAERLGHGLGV